MIDPRDKPQLLGVIAWIFATFYVTVQVGVSKFVRAVALHTSFVRYIKFSLQYPCIAKVLTNFETFT